MSAARAALRRLQSEQREAERRFKLDGPTVVRAMPVPDALRDPTHRQSVGEALLVAALVATTGDRVAHGSECFTCGRPWSTARTCQMALLGDGKEGAFVAFACGPCCGDGHRTFVERLKAALADVLKLEGVRELALAPGGHA